VVTSLGIDRLTIRQLAAVMAVVLAIANLPSIGVIVISDRSGPTISLDLCHPLQSLDTSTNVILIARPARPETGAEILSHDTLAQIVPILKSKFAETPDPPPPKQFC
jgi:hypothetical protein